MAGLGDFVWHDLNRDGIQQTNEPGISNVTVQLVNCTNNVVLATTATDTNGLYLFFNLCPGQYKVTFALPPNFQFTLPNVGTNTLDSDADPVTGESRETYERRRDR